MLAPRPSRAESQAPGDPPGGPTPERPGYGHPGSSAYPAKHATCEVRYGGNGSLCQGLNDRRDVNDFWHLGELVASTEINMLPRHGRDLRQQRGAGGVTTPHVDAMC